MGSEDHFRSMLHDIMSAEKFTDITIVCDDMRPISSHRNILSACSPVLNDMLQIHADSPDTVLYLKGIDYEEMQSIMRFIYLGQVTFNHGRIQQFLSAAQCLKLKDFNDLNDLLVPSNKDLSLKEAGQKSDNRLSKIEERIIEGQQSKSCSVTSKDEIVHGLMDLEESLYIEDHDVSNALSDQEQTSGTIDDTIMPMDEMIINFEEPLTTKESLNIDERKKNPNEQGDFYFEMKQKHSEQKIRSLKHQHVKNYAKDVDGPVVDKMLGVHNLLMAVLQTQTESSVYLSKIKFPVLIHRLIREGEYPNKNLPSLRDHGAREKKKIREGIEHFRKFQTVPHILCNTDTHDSVASLLKDICEMEDELEGKTPSFLSNTRM